MVRAGLPEPRSPVDASRHSPERRLNRCRALRRRRGFADATSGCGRCPVRAFKEMSGLPTFRSIRTTGTNAGSPTGRESYGDGGLAVVAGVTTCQGVRESRTQGEGGQVSGHHGDRKVRVMRNAETVVGVCRECHGAHETVAGEPVARKAGTAGSGRGPLVKGRITGTSPAAYRCCTWPLAGLDR